MSTQKIPQEATKLKKLAKITARYMEMEEFKDSDHHAGYFCYNCMYFIKPNHCAIVTDEGPDAYGMTSDKIHLTKYVLCGKQINRKYILVAPALENQTSPPQMSLQLFHVKYAMQHLTQGKS